ncbi:MAG TPA: efflux RND transporter periplasmic adaptor subunit [Candidatus Baltobacteraceae bacterium]|nr:efflux RND transporter periplasmic adaptor subunit [Candidatus Baltobacteraceae bacterium]
MSTIAVPKLPPLTRTFGAVGARTRWLLIAGLALLCIAAATAGLVRARAQVSYVTAPATQQTLVQTVTASGVVNPQNNISVGTQVSGTISEIDVDYNSKVKKDQILARLDPSTLQAQLDQARAALAQAQSQVSAADANASGAASATDVAAANARAQAAAVGAAQANAQKAQAALSLAQTTLTRDSSLLSQGYLARSTVDTDRANAAQDQADVASAQAAIAQAQAQAQAGAAAIGQNGSTQAAQAATAQGAQANVAAAQAVVQEDQLNLDHTIIRSPVDGTVVARDVSVGQTVAASLQTPTLFAIAQDLGKMEIDINVGEPDIGNVKRGENVDFNVLAYPNRTFHGSVSEVRINPQTLNNVVTYDVVVLVDNSDGALLPGMTANASIDVATAKNAIVVPISALQWKPLNGTHRKTTTGASAPNSASPWGAVDASAVTASAVTGGSSGAIFVQRDGKLQRVSVNVTLATATQAAVVPAQGSTLQSGDAVIIASNGSARSQTTRAQTGRSPMSGSPAGGAMRGIH